MYAVAAEAWVGRDGLASSRDAFPPTCPLASSTRIFAFGFSRFAQKAVDRPLIPPPTTMRSYCPVSVWIWKVPCVSSTLLFATFTELVFHVSRSSRSQCAAVKALGVLPPRSARGSRPIGPSGGNVVPGG
jgi:hypothetical protein